MRPNISKGEYTTMETFDVIALKALANRRRLAMLGLLAKGEHGVGELQRLIGLEQSAVSQHLARLRSAGLVRRRRDGQAIYYRLDGRRVAAVIAGLQRILLSSGASASRSGPPRGAAEDRREWSRGAGSRPAR